MTSPVIDLLAIALSKYRKDNRLTQEAAAERVGCSIPTYRSLEQPSPRPGMLPDPKLSTLMRVFVMLGLDQGIVEVLASDVRDLPDALDASRERKDDIGLL